MIKRTHSFILCLVLLSGGLFSFGKAQAQVQTSVNPAARPVLFAKKFVGNLGGKQATFFIQRDGENLGGQMFFDDKKEAFYLSGGFSSDGKISFQIRFDEDNISRFDGMISGSSVIEGTYLHASGSKTPHAVRLTEESTSLVAIDRFEIGHSKCWDKWDEERDGSNYRDSACYSKYLTQVVIRLQDEVSSMAVNDSLLRELRSTNCASGLTGGVEEMRSAVWMEVEGASADGGPVEYDYFSGIHSFNRGVLCIDFHDFYWEPLHPRGGEDFYRYMNFDMANGKPVRLGDLLESEGLSSLNDLVLQKILEEVPLEELDQEGVNGLIYAGRTNYRFDLFGITIPVYRYEIGPGYLGEREVFVSFEELKNLPGKKSKFIYE
jgi:hypothetical protein